MLAASLERIEQMGALEQLSVSLSALVGSPLSHDALREDRFLAELIV